MKTDINYTIRQIGPEYYSSVLNLRSVIYNALKDRSHIYLSSGEYVKRCLGNSGMVFGCFSGNGLVAFQMLYFPSGDPSCISPTGGINLEVPPAERPGVAYLSTAGVHPDHRGNKLGNRMLEMAIEKLRYHSYRHLWGMPAPTNHYIRPVLMKEGMALRKLVAKNGSELRYIAHLDLKAPIEPEPVYDSIMDVESNDLVRQYMLFENGFEGFQQIRVDGGLKIRFGLRTPAGKYEIKVSRQYGLSMPGIRRPGNIHKNTADVSPRSFLRI